ncbi:WhiB family redox-sensing transcriptional regulator [Nocardiopsis arvandica]|uniref:WhiB family redox-sensing transcriptional regulator n=1 Tax=Nocardiopsis sinuspersici TaxID=501010 RepID=A0A7Y9XBM3_9ACTN|nr:WhiB family transcriptional regulator [Nocardiopsis sinuspersici]NYH52791.1 WhiB family redox-sensing transcriptional regulator [Nocardiopsis sinuspersici]
MDPKNQTRAQLRAGLAEHMLPCAKQPELFFEPDTADRFGEKPAAKELRERSARVLCLSCPARALCLELAVRERPAAGIWAGFTADEINKYSREAA